MRCPDCNKFVGLEMADPEVESIEVSEDGTVTATVHIVRNCAECGTELKSADLEMECEVDVSGHDGSEEEEGESKGKVEHELSVEETGIEAIEEGGGRYQKSYFGAKVTFELSCSCDPSWHVQGEVEDKVAASEMEELV
jgi:hypothetical protein